MSDGVETNELRTVEIDGRSLTLEQVGRVARMEVDRVELARLARDGVQAGRDFVESLLERGEVIYGVSTGFGRLAEVVIPEDKRGALQRNLVRSHASGMGTPLPPPVVRAIVLLRANALARGNSGCRPKVVEALLDLLNAGIHPRVPAMGSVGASGDLAPLAHVALALIGEGEVEMGGTVMEAGRALKAAGLAPVELAEKEGLALINGTQATTGMGILTLLRAEQALETAEVAGACSLEGLRGTPEAFRPEVQEARPHPGQRISAERLREHMADSEIRESHRDDDPRVQDAYCLRCMPQVHGAARETLTHVRRILEVEANATTDNPLIFPEAGAVVSAGNFHAQVVAQALDFLCIALADVAAISERRLERLLNPDLSGLPAFLAEEPGLDSGFMIAQVAVVDILAEMRVLAHPASVDSVPTSANQEDHVSMGMAASRKAARSVELLEYVLGAELMAGAQAVEYHRPLRAATSVERAVSAIRRIVPRLVHDRPLSGDLERMKELVESGEILKEIAR